MSTSDPSPSTELASSPGPADGPLSEDSGATSDPVELAPADEPKQAASDLPAIEAEATQPSTPSAKKEPALADSSIFDVSDVESRIFEPPIDEQPAIEAAVIEAPVVEAAVVDSSSAEEPEPAADEPLEEPALAAFGDLAAFDGLAPRAKRVSLPPLIPETPAAPSQLSSEAGRPADADEAEWELAEELTSVAQNEKPAVATQAETLAAATKQDEKLADVTLQGEKRGDATSQDEELTDATAQAASPARPWRDVDDLEDDENSEDLTGIVHKDEPVAALAASGSRPWRDVDDLDDDEDDPSEYLPTQVLGVPAQTLNQRTLVPPPSRGAVRSRGPGAPLPLPAIPAPPTLPRSVPPSVPPVAFDWILERTGRRAGSLTVLVAGLALLVVGILPLVVLGALVTGFFASENGSLVVTVAGANHGPVEAPVVVADDIPRCKESPCRITKLEPGTHFVRVTAPGYQQMAPRAVTVEKGGEVVLHVELAREPTRVTVADRTPPAPIDLDDPSVKVDALPRSRKAAVSTTASESVHTSTTSRTATAAPTPAAGASGTLNISSNPPSNVVLDGRPLGISPRAGIKVKPGPHQVVFIHPKLGRKNARANVKPGATSNVSVRFR